MKISVAHAAGNKGKWVALEVTDPINVQEAIVRSNVLNDFPELNFEQCKVGIFGKICSLDTPVTDGARVEIYRPIERVVSDDEDDDDDDED
ncbi:RnfH family protein [Celerinatantimonas diazotrophica]|uniref:UPF0125 protein EV690_0641 n=1 Tax=Celerinatantimonas diazotrophica TaxID=412034 RepID=A0A4R1K368_9GAMM|nr:RnfH family protein [Celerinatantimonas diazotrophica]TCK58514.1 hypothetical protein EV690_0641 [Celerinatantimonas diazotrophica]CAG9297143.1 hypothetical protein CEDIAZO_02311 [Celerinatantimonas diazotrophica]